MIFMICTLMFVCFSPTHSFSA